MSNPLKKLAGQTAIYGLGSIVPRFLNQFLTPILTYTYAPAEYGINSQLYSYISFLNIVFTYGMETTFFNFYTKNDDKPKVYNTALFSIIASTVGFTILLLLFSSTFAGFLSSPEYTYLPQFIIWSVLILATDALMVIPFARMRSENRPLLFSMFKLINVLVFGGLTVFFCVVCKRAYDHNDQNFFSTLYDPRIGIGYVFLANLIANAISLLLLARQFAAFSFNIDTELLKRMLSYAWPLLILGLAGMINETLDRLILKILMPDKDAAQVAQGIYGACYKVAMLMSVFIQAFRFAADPFFFNKANDRDSKQTYAYVMKYFMIFCSFLFLGTMMNLDWIRYFINKDYWEGLKV
ncbi:MAG: lipopolysaccharide biosynthesis protein, partial [Bacteroidia bacterium]